MYYTYKLFIKIKYENKPPKLIMLHWEISVQSVTLSAPANNPPVLLNTAPLGAFPTSFTIGIVALLPGREGRGGGGRDAMLAIFKEEIAGLIAPVQLFGAGGR